jgi:hypothetical protein
MRLGTKLLTGCLALAAAGAIWLAPEGYAGDSSTCQRTVRIDPQTSTGEGLGASTFVVHSTGCAAAGSVQYTVEPGSARAGADFVVVSGRLQWADGDKGTRTISVPILPDPAVEADLEEFAVRLTAPSPAVVVAGGFGQGRILDDDSPAQPIWTPKDSFCWRTPPPPSPPPLPPSTLPMPMPGVLCAPTSADTSQPVPLPVTIHWSTVDGTARAGVDFVAVIDRVQTVPAGATTATLEFELLPGSPATATRWFTVRISSVSAGRIVDATATVILYGA